MPTTCTAGGGFGLDSTAGEPGALDLLAGMPGRIDEAAGDIAKFADAAHVAGLACERSYDALTVIEKN